MVYNKEIEYIKTRKVTRRPQHRKMELEQQDKTEPS